MNKLIKWINKNVLNKKELRYRVYFIYRDTQTLFIDTYAKTPAKAVKDAKEHIKKFAKKNKDYKFVKVEEK